MECNKEEAFRAKDIAMKKLEAKDFLGARKFALKAQQLYSDMENISQMICVCNVHCSAASNMVGNELDLYGILQIDQTADDQMIRKQYRKFALLLHPDKNKFSGAEAAFKLIGEAQRVLLDKEKRSFYDLKYRTSINLARQKQPPPRTSRNVNVTKINVSSNTNVRSPHSNQQTQPGAAVSGNNTFWTRCPFCAIRYQYFKEVLNRCLRCQSCKKPFIAYDSYAGAGSDATQPVFPGQNFSTVFGNKAGSEAMKMQTSNASFQSELNAEARQSQKAKPTHKGSNKAKQGSESSRKVNSYRGKKHKEESSESFGSESSLESEEVEIQSDSAEQFRNDGDRCTRRSSRNKQRVSYNENASDDELTINPPKKAKEHGSWGPSTKGDASEKIQQPFVSSSATFNGSHERECNKSNGTDTVDESTKKIFEDDYISASSPETTPEPEFVEYPDPEFCEFDKFREEQCFKVGQLWAAYDTVDAMPRFYAKIRKIFSPGFKLRITWLEPDPDDPLGFAWSEAELPYSCGKFKHGGSEITEDRLMFSHQVICEKGSKGSVLIYPRKGETWAIFKNWDAKWHSIPDYDQKFEFDFVEVLSDYDETDGIHVSLLGKLKGFASVFCRRSATELQIPSTEVLKFSHRVPSCRLSGNERADVPKDSFELDPASTTMNLEEISLPRSNGDVDSSVEGEELLR